MQYQRQSASDPGEIIASERMAKTIRQLLDDEQGFRRGFVVQTGPGHYTLQVVHGSHHIYYTLHE